MPDRRRPLRRRPARRRPDRRGHARREPVRRRSDRRPLPHPAAAQRGPGRRGDQDPGRPAAAGALGFLSDGTTRPPRKNPEEEEEARETARLVEAAGRTAVTVICDIRDEKQCRALVERAVSDFGRIDVLVNNAAYQMSQPDGISAISTEQFDRVMRTNLYGMFWLCKSALPHIPAGGSIINTTSVQAYKPSPHLLDYAMTKGAIVTFTQGLAQMPASDGIRVNAVAPGPVWTPLIPATLPDTTEFGKQSPLGRPAQPAEMAPAYVFLASANASFITGEIMNATGGTPLP
ncbi:SDR family oxidoreductase [Streptomyces cyaneofuscatus]|uniref:SDR family oxidoreductase n=1 Tax=Streptomyces cyaneofuscatus TaxID=66883 RepID=UPI0036DF26E7